MFDEIVPGENYMYVYKKSFYNIGLKDFDEKNPGIFGEFSITIDYFLIKATGHYYKTDLLAELKKLGKKKELLKILEKSCVLCYKDHGFR